MRSYVYNDGDFLPCQDPLPATVAPARGVNTSKELDKYAAAMAKVGFVVSKGSTYVSYMGHMEVYARNHATLPELPLPAQRDANEHFDFLCVLHIGGSYIRIWVPDFPNLFMFFKEIGAKAVEEIDGEAWALRENASRVLGELLTGELTLRVNASS